MTKDETRKAAEVMAAWCDGKVVDWRRLGDKTWCELTSTALPCWDWSSNEYRIQPEPREVWVDLRETESGMRSGVAYTQVELDELKKNVALIPNLVHMREVIP